MSFLSLIGNKANTKQVNTLTLMSAPERLLFEQEEHQEAQQAALTRQLWGTSPGGRPFHRPAASGVDLTEAPIDTAKMKDVLVPQSSSPAPLAALEVLMTSPAAALHVSPSRLPPRIVLPSITPPPPVPSFDHHLGMVVSPSTPQPPMTHVGLSSFPVASAATAVSSTSTSPPPVPAAPLPTRPGFVASATAGWHPFGPSKSSVPASAHSKLADNDAFTTAPKLLVCVLVVVHICIDANFRFPSRRGIDEDSACCVVFLCVCGFFVCGCVCYFTGQPSDARFCCQLL